MALDTIVDAIAVKLATVGNMKGAYSVGSGGRAARYMPQSVDDWPIAVVWPNGGQLNAGNGPESFLHSVEGRIWFSATSADAAFAGLAPFIEQCRVAFRTDVTLAGACTRCLMTGYGEIEGADAHGKEFLVLPITFEVLEHTATNSYSV